MTQIVFPNLDLATAQSEATFYRDSGADAQYVADGTGTYTLTITYPDTTGPVGPGPGPGPAIPGAGLVVFINRLRCELRAGMAGPRTVGTYQVYLNGNAIPGLNGYCVERQGPGDNTASGVTNHRRIEAGTYPLSTHSDGGRYSTVGYITPGAIKQRPWPCLLVMNTGARGGILIHCAAGYWMSTGCINLTSALANAKTDMIFGDSWSHVVQLINGIAANTQNFPTRDDVRIPNCTLVVQGEPELQLSSGAAGAGADAAAGAAAGDDAAAVGAAAGGAAAAAGAAADQDDINSDFKSAIQYAVRLNEIGNASPYQISFAGKGNSGASFGATQGDLAAGQPIVTKTFEAVLTAAGFSAADIQTFTAALSVHLVKNSLSPEDTKRINAALLNGKDLVDKMDASILADVFAGVDKCVSAASAAGRHIEPIALIYMALWINMAGPPTKLLAWLSGNDPGMPHLSTPGAAVTENDIQNYLRATDYFRSNPNNLPHIIQSAEAGALRLQSPAVA